MIKFDSIEELITLAENSNTTISQIVLEETAKKMEISCDEVKKLMLNNLEVMRKAILNGIKKDTKSISGLTGGNAYLMKEYLNSSKSISGSFMGEIIYSALAVAEVNACMGRVVAAPTAGSCGIIPACLITLEKHNNLSQDQTIMGLINASGIGLIIAKVASISGAEGGCQAECGSASAMAASAMIEMLGGSPRMCGDAIAQAIKSQMGLVCDPVAGLVEEPCVIRNVSSAAIAITSVEMTMAGIKSIIPVDEVIKAMDDVGRQLPPSLRETACGGIAISKTAKEIEKELINTMK